MRSLLIRCLAVVLALALGGGHAQAELHPAALSEQPRHDHDHAAGTASQHDHGPLEGVSCCCDCLACVSPVNLTPDLTGAAPATFGVAIRYRDEVVFLPGQILLPEPKPPRPGALT